MIGQAMHHRLQDLRRLSQHHEAEILDLRLWHALSTLQFCGVELHVSQGRATVVLTHLRPDGREEDIAELRCPQPGSAFSPPLEVGLLAQQGGQIRARLTMVSEDAVLDLYLGSNDRPALPQAQVAVVLRARTQTEAEAAIAAFTSAQDRYAPLHLGQHCRLVLDVPNPELAQALSQSLPPSPQETALHLRSGGALWLRRAVYDLAFGDLSDRGVTHLVLQPEGQPLAPEGFVHALALARFLRPGVLVHNAVQAAGNWPHLCLDMMEVLRHDLPGTRLDLYAQALQDKERSAQSLTAQSLTAPPAPPPPPRPRQKLRDQLARLRCPLPAAGTIRMKRDFTRQIRGLDLAHRQALRQLEDHLRHNHLWESERAHHDQERASRTLLSLLRNRHKGARAVIVGNGPSLRASDLDRLQQTVTFGSNKIWLAYEDTPWRPTYYSVEDHLVLQNNRDRIATLTDSLKIFPANMRHFGYHAGDTLFAPFLPPLSFEDPLSDPEFPAFSRDLSHGIAWGSTIVYSQIQMALYMGCTEIILIGVDHAYQLPAEKHGNAYVDGGEQNHFHPDYRDPGEIWHQPNLAVLEVSYAKARRVCEAAGARLLNASRETALEVIERADFDHLFPLAGPVEDSHT